MKREKYSHLEGKVAGVRGCLERVNNQKGGECIQIIFPKRFTTAMFPLIVSETETFFIASLAKINLIKK